MKLVANWRAVALRSHSMWAVYLGILCLVMPDLIFLTAGVDTNPRVWATAGLLLLAYGGIGRLWDQGIDRSKLKSAGAVSVAAFLLVALPLVAKWEGKSNDAYLDIVNVPTICFGHTKGVKLGDHMTDAQCEALLKAELLEYREGLHRHFTAATLSKRLTPERDAAYISLAYNVGIGGAGRSTATRRLNAGNIAGGCEALTWWNRAGGRVVRGLVRRRSDEYRLCMMGLA